MILITGATGTVGSHLVQILLEQKIPFRAGVHRRPMEIEGINSYIINYDKPETLQSALKGVRKVFLVLPLTFDQQAMTKAGQLMVEVAHRAGVEHIVKLSAYGAGVQGYPHARWHRHVERIIENSGLNWTFLRPNAFMQTLLEDWSESIHEEGKFYDAVEGASYAPIDARDIARVAARTLTEADHAGKSYELTGPESLSWEQAAETLGRILGRNVRYVRISDDDLRQKILAGGLSEELADAWVEVHRYTRRFPSTVTTCVKDITAQTPVSFEEFCREYALSKISSSL
jgi:uncharacterized protein YbjT (DUF2867 family)